MSDVAAVLLFTAVVLYAVFGGADYGAGFWDLTAGDARRGARTRALIERSIGPVWEANHVWLVFCLVILWTAFPDAFAAILTTLYVPLVLAMFGIVLRGCGFAFRKQVEGLRATRAAGAAFAASSVVTPFFLGATAGGIASGRVLLPPDHAGAMEVWFNPTALLMGALAVVACAYLSAVFLVAEARIAGDTALEARFRRCVLGAAAAVGVLAAAGIGILRADSPRMFHRLLGPGLPLVIVSAVCGLFTLAQPRRVRPQLLRVVAVAAVASIVVGWGVAQYPYLLGTHLTLAAGAAPQATLVTTTVIFGVAVLLCGPSLLFLYVLQQRGELETG